MNFFVLSELTKWNHFFIRPRDGSPSGTCKSPGWFYTYFPFIAVFCLLHRLYIKERRSDLRPNTPSTLFVLLNPIIITIINFLYTNNLVAQTHQSQINESYQRQSHGPFEHFTKIKFYCTLFEYFYSAVLWCKHSTLHSIYLFTTDLKTNVLMHGNISL